MKPPRRAFAGALSRALAGPVGGVLALAGAVGCQLPSPLLPEARGSVGSPNDGVLTDGAPLPNRAPGLALYRPWGDKRYGLPRLVALLTSAAADVDGQRAGAPLLVGDLSAERGGPIPNHASHRSGRDVDILFYVTTPAGAPVPSSGFVRFAGDGLGKADGAFVRFDVERNWLLVRALLTSKEAEVSWLFVARPLEALLIEHAIARGESTDLLARAEAVLQQPGDSAPHDDHFHLRIRCRAEEIPRGCVDGGPAWPWYPPLPGAAALTAEELAAIAEEPAPAPDPSLQALETLP